MAKRHAALLYQNKLNCSRLSRFTATGMICKSATASPDTSDYVIELRAYALMWGVTGIRLYTVAPGQRSRSHTHWFKRINQFIKT
jgi:hypothetical protein